MANRSVDSSKKGIYVARKNTLLTKLNDSINGLNENFSNILNCAKLESESGEVFTESNNFQLEVYSHRLVIIITLWTCFSKFL